MIGSHFPRQSVVVKLGIERVGFNFVPASKVAATREYFLRKGFCRIRGKRLDYGIYQRDADEPTLLVGRIGVRYYMKQVTLRSLDTVTAYDRAMINNSFVALLDEMDKPAF